MSRTTFIPVKSEDLRTLTKSCISAFIHPYRKNDAPDGYIQPQRRDKKGVSQALVWFPVGTMGSPHGYLIWICVSDIFKAIQESEL